MSSSFWTDALEDLGDNWDLVVSAASDAVANLNPLDDQFLTGNATNTARTVEEQLARDQGRPVDPARIEASGVGGFGLVVQAARNTASDVGNVAGDALDGAGKVAGGALDLLTNKWFLAAAALVVVAVVAAPYVAPVLARAVRS